MVCLTFVVDFSLNFTDPSSIEQNRKKQSGTFNFNIFNDLLKHKQTNKQTNTQTNKQTCRHEKRHYNSTIFTICFTDLFKNVSI